MLIKPEYQQFQMGPNDTGSSQIVICLLTDKIKALTSHMQTHKKDVHSLRGLKKAVSTRKKLLKYIGKKDQDLYKTLIDTLKIRA